MFWHNSMVCSRMQTKCHDCISYFIASTPVVFLLFVHSSDTSAETTHVGALVRYVGPLGTMELLKTYRLRLATVVRVGLAVLCGGETIEIQHVIIDKHYSDVIMNTMASQITSLTIFTQLFGQAQIKENIKALCHWSLWGGFTGDWWNVSIWWSTIYPKKYAHGFVVLCFVVVMQSFIMNSH